MKLTRAVEEKNRLFKKLEKEKNIKQEHLISEAVKNTIIKNWRTRKILSKNN